MAAPKSNETVFTIKAETTRDYGVVKHTIAYAETFHSDAGHTTYTAYAKCMAVIDELFADYESAYLPNIKQAEYQRTIEQPSENSGVWLEATEFSHQQKEGKDYYNVKAGRYQKFGVACWPECIGREQAIEQLGGRWSMPVKWRVLVDESGKYPKVLNIEFAPF